MIQLAWRFLMFQKESALTLWYRARTADSRSAYPSNRTYRIPWTPIGTLAGRLPVIP
jgi:hypothetical protein